MSAAASSVPPSMMSAHHRPTPSISRDGISPSASAHSLASFTNTAPSSSLSSGPYNQSGMTRSNSNLNAVNTPNATHSSSLSTSRSTSSLTLSSYSTPTSPHGVAVSSSSSSSSSAASLVNRPSLIEYRDYRFLIMDAPTESNLSAYIEMLKKKNVTCVVRACEPTYRTDALVKGGIQVLEAPFPDGDPPPEHIINEWLALIQRVQGPPLHSKNTKSDKTPDTTANTDDKNNTSPSGSNPNKPVIAVHCVAGLGRAPVLVAIALMEAGMQPLDVIDFIRKRRRGAFNSKQLKYIQSYKPRKDNKDKCNIM